MTSPLRIATRGSPLAMWQANHVAAMLRPHAGPRSIQLVTIHTTGDAVQDRSLSAIGGIGVFTKEIQNAVLDGRADLAVHSLKDLPTLPTNGMTLAAVPPRGPHADVLVAPLYNRFDNLPRGARIGTSSTRRRSQALHRRSDLRMLDLRGNVETRLRKLRDEGLDGILLAQAGLERLGLASEITEILDAGWMLPAVGQGALALECRTADADTLRLAQTIHHPPAYQAVACERAFLRQLGGGCLLPIAALAEVQSGSIHLRGAVFSPDGKETLGGEASGPIGAPEAVGVSLADQLLERGARRLLGS